jgi:hypothetical protein
MLERCLASVAVLFLAWAVLATCAEGDARPAIWVLR